jgi:acetyltransferase-like isoleucine patch superfamily enzyme
VKKHEIEGIIEALIGFPKSIIVNFKCLKFKDAIKLPIIVSRHVYLRSVKGKIQINAPIKTGMILFGIGNVGIFDKKKSRSVLELGKDGKIIFGGKARFGNGVKVSVGGELYLGDDFTMTAESAIFYAKKITFGDNCLVSWENMIMDTDVHKVFKDGSQINNDREITIGNHVWIGSRCMILKGSQIGNDNVVAAGSLVVGQQNQQNTIIGGSPAKVLSSEIEWVR